MKISSAKIKIFAQNTDKGYSLQPNRLTEVVPTSTHNLCFGSKIRKMSTPVYPSYTI